MTETENKVKVEGTRPRHKHFFSANTGIRMGMGKAGEGTVHGMCSCGMPYLIPPAEVGSTISILRFQINGYLHNVYYAQYNDPVFMDGILKVLVKMASLEPVPTFVGVEFQKFMEMFCDEAVRAYLGASSSIGKEIPIQPIADWAAERGYEAAAWKGLVP